MICPSCLGAADLTPLSAPPVCPSCGGELLLRGRYRLDAVLAGSSRGHRFRGWDTTTGQAIVAKEHPVGIRADPKRTELAEREARVQAELHHPAIPAAIDSFSSGTGRARAFWTVQAYVEGRDLAAECAARRYTVSEVLDILAEVLDIVAWLHALSPPVFHRDVKPANLIRDAEGRIHLVDFGAVRDALEGGSGGSTIAGTFGYMAPEQFGGAVGPGLDIFGAGATAIALLSRQDPAALHDRAGRFDWRGAVAAPKPVMDLLAALVHPDPVHRPSNAAALADVARRLAHSIAPPSGVVPRRPTLLPSWERSAADPASAGPVLDPVPGFADPPSRPAEWPEGNAGAVPALRRAAGTTSTKARSSVGSNIAAISVLGSVFLLMISVICVPLIVFLRLTAAEPEATQSPVPQPAPRVGLPSQGVPSTLHCSIQPNTRVDIDPRSLVDAPNDLRVVARKMLPVRPVEAGQPFEGVCGATVVVGRDGLGQSARIVGESCPLDQGLQMCRALESWRWEPFGDEAHPLGVTYISLRFRSESPPPTEGSPATPE